MAAGCSAWAAAVGLLALAACAANPTPAPPPAGAATDVADAPTPRDAGAARVPCSARNDCACSSHYAPISAAQLRDTASPGDCMVTCQDGFCAAAQGPL